MSEKKDKTNGSEGPRAKALRLGSHRVNGALSRLRQIGNLGAAVYELADADKEKICDAIFSAAHEMKRRLYERSERKAFSL